MSYRQGLFLSTAAALIAAVLGAGTTYLVLKGQRPPPDEARPIPPVEVREIRAMRDILPAITEKTLLVFDLDNTLIEPEGQLGSDQWYDYLTRRYVEVDMLDEHKAQDQAMDVWNQTQALIKIKAVERDTPGIILAQQGRGIPTMGLTARTPAIADTTLQQLATIGVRLGADTVSAEEVRLKVDDATLFKEGVLFVGERNDKGKALLQFLRHIKDTHRRVVFVDDKRKHVLNVQRALAGSGIEYVGFRYGATDEKVAQFHRDTSHPDLFIRGVLPDQTRDALKKAQR